MNLYYYNERMELIMAKVEEIIAASKLGEIIGKNKKKKCDCKKKVVCVLGVIGVVAAVAGIVYAIYRYVTSETLEDFDEDFDDDFEDEDFDVELKNASSEE